MTAVVTCFAFLTGFLTVFGLNLIVTDVFLRDREKMRRRLDEQFAKMEQDRMQKTLAGQDLDAMAAEAFRETADNKTLLFRLEEFIEQSGVELAVGRLVFACLGCGLVFGLAFGLLLWSALPGVFVGIISCILPALYVGYKRQKRMDKIRSQLPDTLELMSRILRSGQTIAQAMLAVASEFKPPIGSEFGYCYEQQNLGLGMDVALRDLARRTGVLEIRIFVLGLMVHSRSGGNLTELLDNLATVVRERFKLRGRIKAMTAEGRFQAAALIILPVFAYLALLVVSRDYALKLLEYPWVLIGCAISMAIGALWIRKIVNFDF